MDLINDDSLNEIEKKLLGMRASSSRAQETQSKQEPLQCQGAIPTQTYIAKQVRTDPVEDQIKAYMARPYSIGPIADKFKDLANVPIHLHRRPVKMDFPDDELIGRPGITMTRGTPEFIAILGRATIPMIASGFSPSGAAALFTLAYNMTAPGAGGKHSEFLLPEVTELETIGDKSYSEFSDRILTATGIVRPITGIEDDVREAAVYAYIAGSLMRLFTKSQSNYVKAWNHIKTGFSRFYGSDIDVQLPTPSEVALKGLAVWFSGERRAKQTLYRILYLSNTAQTHRGFKRFLYDMHLTNTGMHIISMFTDLCKILNCSTDLVLEKFKVREFERQIDCLIAVLNLSKSTSDSHKLSMWRYGRIFDEAFMADIQTKSCPKLVCIFAQALKAEMPTAYADVLQIAQLTDLSEIMRGKCAAVASKLLMSIREQNNQDSQGGGTIKTIKDSGK